MPRTRSLAWAELKIGVLAVVAVALVALLTFLVGGQAGFFWQQYHLKTRFADVAGLKGGAVVRVAGVEVGKVTSASFEGVEVEVVMQVREDMRSRITDHSRASIGSLSLLGEPVIDITPSGAGTPLTDWAYVTPGRSQSQFSDVALSASASLDEATKLLREVRAGNGTVGRLFTDDQLYKDIEGFVAAAETVAQHLAGGRGTLGMLAKDPQAYKSLVSALKNLDEMTQRLNAGQGTLGRLMADDALAASLSSAGRNIDALSDKLNQGQGTAGKLINERELYDRLNRMAERLDQVSTRLEAGEGTVGQLLRDRHLYENMNGAASELRALVGDIRKDPRKYLNVKVSIF